MTLASDVARAIRGAEAQGLVPGTSRPAARGFSGDKLLGMLQRLAQLVPADRCYVEIGVFDGLTLLTVSGMRSDLACFGIDDGSLANNDFSKIERARSNARVIVGDYEDVFAAFRERVGDRKIGLYFVDGPHDYRSQRMCLDLAVPYLDERAILVVDDSNYEHVRQANRDFLVCRPEFRLVFDAYTPTHPHNMSDAEQAEAARGWWNGVNVIVRDSSIAPIYPPVAPTRDRFLLDHRVHGSGASAFLDRVLSLAEHTLATDPSPRMAARMLVALVRERWRARDLLPKYPSLNTYSERLPGHRLHPAL